MSEAVEASWCYFFENWFMKLKFPNFLKPLGTIFQNYWSFYPSELIYFALFTMRHPVYDGFIQAMKAGKLAILAQIQPKFQFLFHKYLPPWDFSIMTLLLSRITSKDRFRVSVVYNWDVFLFRKFWLYLKTRHVRKKYFSTHNFMVSY